MISILIFNHLSQNKRYLDACLKSVTLQRGIEHEAICISDAETPPEVPEGVFLHHNMKLDNLSAKINYGVKHLCSEKSEGYLLVSDDVVLSRDYAAGLNAVAHSAPMLVAGMSNSENGNYYLSNLPFQQNEEYSEAAVEYAINQPHGRDVLLRVPLVPFYAIYISRTVWDMVGEGFNEECHVRWNDIIFSRRCIAKGINGMVNTGVFCLHWGSKTVSLSPKEDFDRADAEYLKITGNLSNSYHEITKPI